MKKKEKAQLESPLDLFSLIFFFSLSAESAVLKESHKDGVKAYRGKF